LVFEVIGSPTPEASCKLDRRVWLEADCNEDPKSIDEPALLLYRDDNQIGPARSPNAFDQERMNVSKGSKAVTSKSQLMQLRMLALKNAPIDSIADFRRALAPAICDDNAAAPPGATQPRRSANVAYPPETVSVSPGWTAGRSQAGGDS
jgi:hypothetical protein